MKLNLSIYKKLLLLLAGLSMPQASQADIYRPTTALQLINAVIAANASSADDIIDLTGQTIVFANNCFNIGPTNANCVTQNALPNIVSSATAGRLAIINGGIERSPSAVTNFRLIQALSGSDVSLFNLVITNGYAYDGVCNGTSADANCNGGAIYNAGTLEIQNTTLASNQSYYSGGAIYNAVGAVLAVQSSDINSNSAQNIEAGTGGGGGIYNAYATVMSYGVIETITNTTIGYNNTPGYGGGINNQGQAINIFDSTIAYNYACSGLVGGICPDPSTGAGGGIYYGQHGIALQITNSTIAENQANQGGGIYIDSLPPPVGANDNVPVENAGIYIYNSTISANTANDGGGGIFNSLYGEIDGLASTIVAGNIDTESQFETTYSPDVLDLAYVFSGYTASNITDAGYNLIGNNGFNAGGTVPGTADFVSGDNNDIVGSPEAPVDPGLDRLNYNGGFTYTMALFPHSPAINQGIDPYSLFYDQRGPGFHRIKCSRPDIGAFERQVCY